MPQSESLIAGRVDLQVSAEILAARKKKWQLPARTRLEPGSLLDRYRRLVGTATEGSRLE